jgi:hypothetical protein
MPAWNLGSYLPPLYDSQDQRNQHENSRGTGCQFIQSFLQPFRGAEKLGRPANAAKPLPFGGMKQDKNNQKKRAKYLDEYQSLLHLQQYLII